MDKDTILIVDVGERDDLIGRAGYTVIMLKDADDVADWLWADRETVAESVIGSDAFEPDLRETLRRDWPITTVREV